MEPEGGRNGSPLLNCVEGFQRFNSLPRGDEWRGSRIPCIIREPCALNALHSPPTPFWKSLHLALLESFQKRRWWGVGGFHSSSLREDLQDDRDFDEKESRPGEWKGKHRCPGSTGFPPLSAMVWSFHQGNGCEGHHGW